MRKRIRILMLAAMVAAVVVPVGFALSLDPRTQATAPPSSLQLPLSAVTESSRFAATSTAFAATTTAAMSAWPAIPDAAKLFVAGTVLCGLAAAMRRTS
jgi:hypothetical protein